MARSIYKGPYIDYFLLKKIKKINLKKNKKIIKTWSRKSTITPSMIGYTISVHNGKKFIPVIINENMIGHKLGEFSLTRIFKKHSGDKKK